MEKNTIVTLDKNDRWYLAEETIQNGKKYFLALKLEDNDEPGDESKIYEEEIEGENFYLNEVIDEDILKYLSAIFITKTNDDIENFKDELSN